MLARNGMPDVTVTEMAPGVLLVVNPEATSWGRPPPRRFCERVWQMCRCLGALPCHAVSFEQFHS